MRNIIIILFFSYISTSQSQSISNGYYSSPKSKNKYFSDFFYKFEDTNNFKYISFGWEGNGFGIGKYEIKNDSLYLKFENCHPCGEDRYLERIEGNSDSLKINLKTMYESDLVNLSCRVAETNEVFSADSNGILKKTIPKNGRDLTLLFSFIGHRVVPIKITKEIIELNGTIIFDDYFTSSANEIKSYKIIKMNEDSLKLYIVNEKVKLKKISEEDLVKKLKKYTSNNKYEFYVKYFL